MKKKIILSVFTVLSTLGIISVNHKEVQAAVTVASMDFDQNNRIDVIDLASLADHCNLTKTTATAKYDLNGDSAIDLYDLVEVSSVVGTKINKVADTTDLTDKFTDPAFKIAILGKIGKTRIKYGDIKNITTLNLQNRLIRNLNGIEYFTSLTKLHANNNLLTRLDLSGNIELTEVNVSNNFLTSIDLSSNTRLTDLSCNKNRLTDLDLSKNARLNSLNVSNNQLISLSLSRNTRLTSLICDSNYLGTLDVSNNRDLKNLSASNNILGSLNVSRNTELTNLNVSNNKIVNLDLSNNGELISLICTENKIKNLDITKNVKLTTLECLKNEIKTLYSIKDSWKSEGYKLQYKDDDRKWFTSDLKITLAVFS